MFDSHFPYRFINFQERKEPVPHRLFSYSIQARNNTRYIAQLEEYGLNTYAVKFYCTLHKRRTDRYSLFTNHGFCARMLTTIARIVLEFVDQKNQFASFIFIGSPCADENNQSTRRFKLYQRICLNMIAPTRFFQAFNEERSTILLLNNANTDQALATKIEEMFDELYPISIA